MMEQRRFSRVSQTLPVQYRPAGSLADIWRNGTLANISAVGIRLVTPEPLEVSEIVALELALPGAKESLSVRARVVWQQARGSGVTEHGLEFLDVSPEQQAAIDAFVEFLNRRA
jgi:c-di-GMP-binding flagellar brake protein YcgR